MADPTSPQNIPRWKWDSSQKKQEEPAQQSVQKPTQTSSSNRVVQPRPIPSRVTQQVSREQPRGVPDTPFPSQQNQPLTKQQMIYQNQKDFVVGTHSFIQQRQQLKQRQGAIRPDEQYVMQTEGLTYSKGQILTGNQIRGLYGRDIKSNTESYAGYARGQKSSFKQIKQLPTGTTFTPTKEGYQANIPETAQLEFSKTAMKQIERQPPGIQNIQLTQFYMGSNLAAVGKGVADFLGIGKQYDVGMAWQFSQGNKKNFGELIGAQKYGTRYTSWGAYLLGGIKGETKILEKHPIEATIGNIGAEAAQWVGFSYATKPITKGATFLFTKGVQKLPAISERLSLEFLPYSGKTLQKLSATQIGKNVGLWSKGNVPVNLFAKTNIGVSERLATKGLGTESITTFQQFKYIPQRVWGFSERQFIPRTEAAGYLSKIGKPSIDISFPTVRSYGKAPYIKTEITGVVEAKGLSKNMRGFYGSLREEQSLQTRLLPSYKAVGEHGSIYNVGRGGPLLESDILGKDSIKTLSPVRGMSRNPEWYELSKRMNIDTTRPFKTPKGFFNSESAGASLIRPQSELVLQKTSGYTKGAFHFESDMFKLPAREFGSFSLSSFIYGSVKASSFHQQLKPESFYMSIQKQNNVVSFKSIQSSISSHKKSLVSLSMQKQDKITVSIFDKIKTNASIKEKGYLSKSQIKYNYGFKIPPVLLPKKKIEGVSASGADLKSFMARYKFREFKIPDFNKLVKI